MTTPIDLDALEQLAQHATPGRREVRGPGVSDQIYLIEDASSLVMPSDHDLYWHTDDDRDFTAAFNREVALALIAEAREARALKVQITAASERAETARDWPVYSALESLLVGICP